MKVSDEHRKALFFDRLAEVLESNGRVNQEHSAQLVAEFPELAEEIRDFQSGQAELDCLLQPSLPASDHATDNALSDTVRIPTAMPEIQGYEFIREIARGGMGVVYEVRHLGLGRTVALKMVRFEGSGRSHEQNVRQFEREARRIAQLDHPHVVPLYESARQRDGHFFTMRLLSGGSLADRLRQTRLSQKEAARIVANIAQGVHHAHQRGILHRDIKPGNILFDENDTPQIGDFGLAKTIDADASLHSGAIVGTPMYMAPEQAQGIPSLTTSADIYSLGAVLYESLVGRPPFVSQNPLNILLQLARDEPPRPSALNHRIDKDLETICLKCLDKEPERRYGSAESLAEDLKRWLHNEPVVARRVSSIYRLRKWAKRSPGLATMSCAAVVAIVACIALLVVGNRAVRNEQSRTHAALEDLQRVSYFQNIALAEHALLSGDEEQAQRSLDASPSNLRQWEWRYLQGILASDTMSHQLAGELACLAVAPDSNKVLIGGGISGQSGKVWMYDQRLRRPPRIVIDSDDSVTALAMNSVASLAALGDQDGAIKVWSLLNSSQSRELPTRFQNAVHGLSFSPDGRLLAIASGQQIRVIDAQSGETVWQNDDHRQPVWCVDFSNNGQFVASCSSDQTIRVWSAKTGATERLLTGHRDLVRSIRFSPDDTKLVSASYDGTARLWGFATGNEIAQLNVPNGYITHASFDSAGNRILLAHDNRSISIWNSETYRRISLHRGHDAAVWGAEFVNGGRDLVSVGDDSMLRGWDVDAESLTQRLSAEGRVIEDFELSPNASFFTSRFEHDNGIQVGDAKSEKVLFELPKPDQVSAWQFSRDSRRIAAQHYSGTLDIFDCNTGDKEYSVQVGTGPFALGRDYLASRSRDNELELRDISMQSLLNSVAVNGTIAHLAFSRNDRFLQARVREPDKEHCIVFDTTTMQQLIMFHEACELTFSEDEAVVAKFGFDNLVELIDTKTTNSIRQLDVGARVIAATFLPTRDDIEKTANDELSNSRICFATADGRVTVWDTTTGRLVLTLDRLEEQITAFCTDDDALVGFNRLGLVRCWRAQPIRQIHRR